MEKYTAWFTLGIFIISVLSFLLNHIGAERLKQFILTVGNSKELKFAYSFLNIIFLFLGLLSGFLAGILLTLRGDFYLGVFAFLLMSTASLIFWFVNYKLAQ